VAQKERMFFKWLVVGKVKVGDLPTPPEKSAEGSVQLTCSSATLSIAFLQSSSFFLETIENKKVTII
jgi:hypothetical protein